MKTGKIVKKEKCKKGQLFPTIPLMKVMKKVQLLSWSSIFYILYHFNNY